MAKSEKFTGQRVDLERLATRIENFLREEKFELAFSKDPNEPETWFFIQARKLSAMRTIAGARRSLDITIRGDPNNFDVSMGSGEWGKNVIIGGVTSGVLLTLLTGPVGPAVYVGLLYSGKHFENKLWKYIKDQVTHLNNSVVAMVVAESTTTKTGTSSQTILQSSDIREYPSDYVRGFPNWNTEIKEGKLLLERYVGEGNDKIIFRAPDDSREIIIPAKDISEARIVNSKNRSAVSKDLMVEISYKNPDTGKAVKPIFNLTDNVIRGVVAGINELVAEDRDGLKKLHHTKVISDIKYCTSCGYKLAADSKFCSACGY